MSCSCLAFSFATQKNKTWPEVWGKRSRVCYVVCLHVCVSFPFVSFHVFWQTQRRSFRTHVKENGDTFSKVWNLQATMSDNTTHTSLSPGKQQWMYCAADSFCTMVFNACLWRQFKQQQRTNILIAVNIIFLISPLIQMLHRSQITTQ